MAKRQTSKPSWFAVNRNDEDEAEVMIYDYIGAFGITAKQFVDELASVKAENITLRINSPGGEVFDGSAIYNAIKAHPAHITAKIDGVAASAASYIAMAADTIVMADNSYMMIHESWGGAMGFSADLRGVADLLDKMNDNLVAAYAKKSGKPNDEIRAALAAETWFTASEAKEFGLADAVEDGDENDEKMPASRAEFDYRIFNKIPDPVMKRWGVNRDTIGLRPAARAAVREPAAVPTQEIPMNLEAFKAYAAEHPDAVASYIEQGKKAGAIEARAAEAERLRLILDVCPGREALAVQTFLAGQDADAVKVVAAHLASEAKAAETREAALRAELAASKLALEKASFAQGGQPGLDLKAAAEPVNPADAPKPDNPAEVKVWAKAKAEAEWAAKDARVARFKEKNAYVAFRTAQESGMLQVA